MTEPSETHHVPEVKGESVTPTDRFWLDNARQAAVESIRSSEDGARQLIAITSFSQTVYFAAVSFSGVAKALAQFSAIQQWLATGALILPFLFWIVSLIFATLVLRPRTYLTDLNSPDRARDGHFQAVVSKHRQLEFAHLCLMLGFGALLVNIVFLWRI